MVGAGIGAGEATILTTTVIMVADGEVPIGMATITDIGMATGTDIGTVTTEAINHTKQHIMHPVQEEDVATVTASEIIEETVAATAAGQEITLLPTSATPPHRPVQQLLQSPHQEEITPELPQEEMITL